MIKRLIWVALGAGLTAFAIKKFRDYLKKSSPEAIGKRLVEGAGELGGAAEGFIDRARAAMAEREEELNDALGLTQPATDESPEPEQRA